MALKQELHGPLMVVFKMEAKLPRMEEIIIMTKSGKEKKRKGVFHIKCFSMSAMLYQLKIGQKYICWTKILVCQGIN